MNKFYIAYMIVLIIVVLMLIVIIPTLGLSLFGGMDVFFLALLSSLFMVAPYLLMVYLLKDYEKCRD
jgi:hypothetical protein